MFFCLPTLLTCACRQQVPRLSECATVCNPLNIDYRFSLSDVSRRDVAEPCVVLFGDTYYLFASGAGGYYCSSDLCHWKLIEPVGLPAEGWAPTVFTWQGKLCYLPAFDTDTIYRTDDPQGGKWKGVPVHLPGGLQEPMVFNDGGRLYLYATSSTSGALVGVELDSVTASPLGQPVELIRTDGEKNGWEKPGERHDWNGAASQPGGAWMTRRGGTYYLQYATPGIQFKSSNDGVYVSANPLGPFRLSPHNPMAYRPEGFVAGIGNGCVFQDRYGNYWHMGTAAVTAHHLLERRLALHPVFFDADSVMYAYTGWGDYPMLIPDHKVHSPAELFPGWMLLSYHKRVRASSELRAHPAACAVDENIRTWWSAASADAGEYLQIDLREVCTINALQIDFSDYESAVWGRNDSIAYRYEVEVSADGKHWQMLVDNSLNLQDAPHDYIPLNKPVRARHVRVTNVSCPTGKFSISDCRVFGRADKPLPKAPRFDKLQRDAEDRRIVRLQWQEVADAVGYRIRFGTLPDKLYNSCVVYDDYVYELRCLQTGQPYYFVVDSFNEAGLTCGTVVRSCS